MSRVALVGELALSAQAGDAFERLLERRKRRKAARARRRTPATAPTAMPALAPVLRPLELELGLGLADVDGDDVEEAPEMIAEVPDAAVDVGVGAAVGVDVGVETVLVVEPPPCDIVDAALGTELVDSEIGKSTELVDTAEDEIEDSVEESGSLDDTVIDAESAGVVDGHLTPNPGTQEAEEGSTPSYPFGDGPGAIPSAREGPRTFIMATMKSRERRILVVVVVMVVVARPWS